jgi:hypothetical protein
LSIAGALAQTQAQHLGEIHVDPQASKSGVTVSLRPSTSIPASPEAAHILSDLIAANGLETDPVAPWHVQLAYDEFDEDGDNVHSGTIEEFYASPKEYRKVIKTDEFSQTEVANGTDLYRLGDQGWPPLATVQAMREELSPLYRANSGGESSPDKLDWTVGGTKLSCVVLRSGRVISENRLLKFCYEPGTIILRYTRGRGWDETVYNDIVQFGRDYVARNVEVTHAGTPFLKIHLAKLEPLTQIDDSVFSPPAGSPGPLSGTITVPSTILMLEYLQHRDPLPHFPRGVRGSVTVKFTVSEEGRVTSAEATDGPKELRKPAREDVMKFRFRPFLILDKPFKVQSTTEYKIQ